jgi:hypothetical protein
MFPVFSGRLFDVRAGDKALGLVTQRYPIIDICRSPRR